MNANGIPTAAYHVLTVLICTGVGTLSLARGTPIMGYTPILTWDQSLRNPLPEKDMGSKEVLWDGDVPPPEQTDTCEHIASRHMRSVIPQYVQVDD